MTLQLRRLLALLVLAGAAGTCTPLLAQAPDPGAEPQVAGTLKDPDFGVRTGASGLERVVEMYQWRADGERYARDWSGQPIDSSRFAPGHDNPPFPLHGQRWMPDEVTVDGHPLDASVLRELGEWREFRPSFSALPGNLAATFQPEGDGLGSAENPLAPEVGDLRIHWLELALPPLDDRIELRDGAWYLRPDAAAAEQPEAGRRGWVAVVAGVVLLLLLALLAARRR